MNLSDAQKAALDRSRISSFPDDKTRPEFDAFVNDILSAKADEHVALWTQRDESKRIAAINLGLQFLSTERIAQLEAEIAAAIPQEGGE